MNEAMKRGFCGFVTAKEMMAVAFLMSRNRRLAAEGVCDVVNRIFSC